MNANQKQTFLVVSDYGMGAVWLLIDARRADEIEAAYPELQVVQDRPDWLDDERWAQLDRDAHFDIDAEPIGFLEALIAEREPDGRGATPKVQLPAMRSPWKAGGLLGSVAGLIVAGLIMYIAWDHNAQGEIHNDSGVNCGYWLLIGLSWFVPVSFSLSLALGGFFALLSRILGRHAS